MRMIRVFFVLVLGCAILPAQLVISKMAGTGNCPNGTPAGDGGQVLAATLCTAGAITADSSGNIYFVDTYTIRKIDPTGVVSTIAGNGFLGTAGDGGPALSANLGYINQLAVDPSGQRLCFGDGFAYKIRCLILNTGIIQGYGTGSGYGGIGDGGNVANAAFAYPYGAAFDSAGNFYLSDWSDNRVRRVDAVTGIITTVVGPGPGYCCSPTGDGGPAVGANIYQPGWLAYYNGGLYITDQGNDRVRLVNLSTGIINTLAGNGNAYTPFGEGGPATQAAIAPGSIVVDSSGNLFIGTDQVVRQVDNSGIITTIAGEVGVSGWGQDDVLATQTVVTGPGAWDPVQKRLLLPDSQRIHQLFFTPPTTTTLTVSANPGIPYAPITFTAAVSPSTATGYVRFYQDVTLVGSYPVVNGAATIPWSSPPGGEFAMKAVYGGDPNNNLSVSGIIEETVQAGSTTTTLRSSPNPSTPGQTVTFTATVSPSAATGTVNLVLGSGSSSMVIGTATLSNGVAVFNISNLPAGTNSLYAWYQYSVSYLASTSAPITQLVQYATTTSLTASPSASTYGSSVTLTATVTPASATGTVQFFNGSTLVGAASVTGGKSQLSVVNLPVGTDSLRAVYGGDATDSGSASAAVSVTVSKANSVTTLSAYPLSSTASGQTVTFTASVTPAAATGTVQFLDGGTVIGATSLSGGTATFATSKLSLGNHSIAAVYLGDGNFNSSRSAALAYKISKK